MKKILFLLSIIILIGCNEKSVNPIVDSQSEINGQFINWNSANKDSIFWRVLIDSVDHILVYSKVASNGSFKLILPEPPSVILKKYIKSEIGDTVYIETKDSIQFSDTTAKFISLNLDHYQRISFPIRCGNTNSFTVNSTTGDYQIYYYYFDKSTEVNGNWYALLRNQIYPDYERTIITKYNKVKFNKGWNQIIIKLVSLEDDKRIFEVSNENRSSTEWILIALPNEFVRLL